MNAGTCWGKNTIGPRGRSVEKAPGSDFTFLTFTKWGYWILVVSLFSNLFWYCVHNCQLLQCGKGTDFSYGPWADRQRDHLFKFFFPNDCQPLKVMKWAATYSNFNDMVIMLYLSSQLLKLIHSLSVTDVNSELLNVTAECWPLHRVASKTFLRKVKWSDKTRLY
jgi:hypothetical protein